MRLWLTKQQDDRYMLTVEKPVVARVKASPNNAAYVKYGDPVGLRNLCSALVKRVFGLTYDLDTFESVRVELDGLVIAVATDGPTGGACERQ